MTAIDKDKYIISDIEVYSYGLITCSVCVPKDMGTRIIEELVNMSFPTGISSKWELSEYKTFSDGITPHPDICGNNSNKLHYLLYCQ